MDMEDGELVGQDHTPSGDTYDPAFEWPGESSNHIQEDISDVDRDGTPTSKSKSRPPSCTTLRLLVTQTFILPRKQKLVVPDDYTELQFGRDVAPPGTETPRIRLKEMEVSKVHATIFWDKERESWGIVDMGSKHGTFVKSFVIKAGRVSLDLRSGEDMRGARLSPSRVASVPRRLYHLDMVTIGSTTFVVHIHDGQEGCVGCAAGSAHEVPLFSVSKRDGEGMGMKRGSDVAGIDVAARNPKKALTMLKRSLLTRHDIDVSSTAEPVDSVYVDRSARRRALHPGSHPDTPGVPNPRSDLPTVSYEPYQTLVTRTNTLPSLPTPRSAEVAPPSQPPAPLPETNIGHRLLMKQGWQPGTSLGLPDDSSSGGGGGLVEPIQVSANAHRAGLGMPVRAPGLSGPSGGAASTVRYGDWREDGKQKRWDGVRARG